MTWQPKAAELTARLSELYGVERYKALRSPAKNVAMNAINDFAQGRSSALKVALNQVTDLDADMAKALKTIIAEA